MIFDKVPRPLNRERTISSYHDARETSDPISKNEVGPLSYTIINQN